MTPSKRSRTTVSNILGDVLCGVDGTRSSYEAVRQAALLCSPRSQLTLLAICGVSGSGHYPTASLAPARAQRALDHARRVARDVGVDSSAELEEGGPVVELLLKRAAKHRLLALGAPKMSRLAHVLVRGVATQAAHTLPCSLLIARRPPSGSRPDEHIMVASDAGSRSAQVVEFTIELARTHDASLMLLNAVHSEQDLHPTRIAAQTEQVQRGLRERATIRVEPGRAHATIVRIAKEKGVTLIVLGSRRLRGVRALGSVSERVVHDAPCSVLVLRPEARRG